MEKTYRKNNSDIQSSHNSVDFPIKKSKEKIEISKTLSKILRHTAKDFCLKIESSGFIELNDLLNLPILKKKNVTEEIIKDIVNSCEKQRFQLENRPPYFIRATQGHSMNSVKNEETLNKLENYKNYPIVVHGTNLEAWNMINKTGLNKMNRNCIRNN